MAAEHPLLEGAYEELAAYLRQLPAAPATREATIRRAAAWRRLSAWVKRLSYALKVLSWPGWVVGCAALVLSMVRPAAHWTWFEPALALCIGCAMVKMFGVLVDLETRALQFLAIVLVSGLMVAVYPAGFGVPLGVGGFYLGLVGLSVASKRRGKLRTLEWMADDPEGCPATVAELQAGTQQVHARLGIARYDDAAYVRHFKLDKQGKRPRPLAVRPPQGRSPFPPKNHVRVQVWRRDPRFDLSSLREFSVCCFLGGSQDASAFDYMQAKCLTMLDMLTPKGRLIRVMLLACRTADGPALLVNTLLGREGGLVGSLREDDRFVRRQLEAYARYVGFPRVLWNLTPTNKRPRLFVRFLRSEDDLGPSVRVPCRLTWEGDPLKVEVFNRREPQDNLYLMLFLEIMNLTDNYATRGAVRCLDQPLANRFLRLAAKGEAPQAEGSVDLDTGLGVLALPASLAGERTRLLLENLSERFPELSPAGLPERVTVLPGDTDRLVSGDLLAGALQVSPALLAVEDPTWRETLLGLGVAQAFLWRLHPLYEEPLLFRLLDPVLPRFDSEVVAALPTLRAIEAQLGLAPRGFLDRIVRRAVRTRHDPFKLLKAKAVYAAFQEWEPRPGDPLELARSLLAKELELEKARRKLFKQLGPALQPLVQEVAAQILAELIQTFLDAEAFPEEFGLERMEQVLGEVEAFRKEITHYRVKLSKPMRAKLERIEARGKLLNELRSCQGLIAKGKLPEARAALATLSGERRAALVAAGLVPVLRRLRAELRRAPFDQLVERLNLDNFW